MTDPGNPRRSLVDSHPPTVREASARLAALRRWRSEDDPGVVAAKRDLVVAQAAALTAEAAAMLAGDGAS